MNRNIVKRKNNLNNSRKIKKEIIHLTVHTQVDSYELRIRPYFIVLYSPVLWSYISVTIYGEKRRSSTAVFSLYTVVKDRIFSVYGRKRSCFLTKCGEKRSFLPSIFTLLPMQLTKTMNPIFQTSPTVRVRPNTQMPK
jgi:hypothetical protein